jgi:hypothetical protein
VGTGFPSRQTRSVCAEIMLKQKHHGGNGLAVSLSLPVADAAGSARPHLDARVHGLRIERVGVTAREFCTRGNARRRRGYARLRDHIMLRHEPRGPHNIPRHYPRGADDILRHNPRGSHEYLALGLWLGACLDGDRCKLGWRPEPLRRQHSCRQIETEELVRAVFVGRGRTSPQQQRGAKREWMDAFQEVLLQYQPAER